MLDMYAKFKDPSKVSDEDISKGYALLKEYCENNDKDIMEVINNPENIKPAAEEINRNLGMIVRRVLTVKVLESIITDNIDLIREKVKEQQKLEKAAEKLKTKAKKK